MNAMHVLSQPWVVRLGWTILHFLWQGALVAGFYAVARTWLKHSSANVRYLLACGALGGMMVLPVVTFNSMRTSESMRPGVPIQSAQAGVRRNCVNADGTGRPG